MQSFSNNRVFSSNTSNQAAKRVNLVHNNSIYYAKPQIHTQIIGLVSNQMAIQASSFHQNRLSAQKKSQHFKKQRDNYHYGLKKGQKILEGKMKWRNSKYSIPNNHKTQFGDFHDSSEMNIKKSSASNLKKEEFEIHQFQVNQKMDIEVQVEQNHNLMVQEQDKFSQASYRKYLEEHNPTVKSQELMPLQQSPDYRVMFYFTPTKPSFNRNQSSKSKTDQKIDSNKKSPQNDGKYRLSYEECCKTIRQLVNTVSVPKVKVLEIEAVSLYDTKTPQERIMVLNQLRKNLNEREKQQIVIQ